MMNANDQAAKRQDETKDEEETMTARFNFMHFMPYVPLPPNHKDYASTWVNFPNKYFDPRTAEKLYARYLDELEYADKIGFDAIVVNEHHNTAYSLMRKTAMNQHKRIAEVARAIMTAAEVLG